MLLLLLPILVPLGLTLVIIGLGRAFAFMALQKPAVPPVTSAVADGTIAQLNSITANRGELLVRQVAAAVKNNMECLTTDMRNEVEGQLSSLQRELQTWVGAVSATSRSGGTCVERPQRARCCMRPRPRPPPRPAPFRNTYWHFDDQF